MNPHRLFSALLALPLSFGFAQDEAPRLLIDSKGHSGKVNVVLFRTTTDELISLGDDKTIRFWDIHSGELIRTLRGEIGDGDGELFAGALSLDDRYLTVGVFDQENTIRVIDLEVGRFVPCCAATETRSSPSTFPMTPTGLPRAARTPPSGSGISPVSKRPPPPLDLSEAEVLDA